MGTPTAISLGTPTAISLKSYQGWLQSSFQIHLKCKDILFCRIMTKYELRMTKIELNYWNFKKNANLSPFYDNLEVKKSLNFDLSKRIKTKTS